VRYGEWGDEGHSDAGCSESRGELGWVRAPGDNAADIDGAIGSGASHSQSRMDQPETPGMMNAVASHHRVEGATVVCKTISTANHAATHHKSRNAGSGSDRQ